MIMLIGYNDVITETVCKNMLSYKSCWPAVPPSDSWHSAVIF